MKKLISLILLCLLTISLLTLTAFADDLNFSGNASFVTLRAGGGGGGGGGGSGGGGSSHHTSHGTKNASLIDYLILPFILFSSSIIFYITLSKRSRASKKLMKQIMQSDSAWKYEDISKTVRDAFYSIQNAWTNMDMSTSSKYMSYELYTEFQTKLNWMAYRHERNILEKIKLIDALPVSVHDDPDNSHDHVWFYIKGKMVDYTVNTETQSRIDGSTLNTSFVEYWQFVRQNDSWVLNKILQKDESYKISFSE